MSPTSLAQSMYDAYREVGLAKYPRLEIPKWADQTPPMQEAWEAAAKRAIGAMIIEQQYESNRESAEWNAKFTFDDREKAQIEHAQDYAEKHSKAGVSGHSAFLLIAKLADALEL